MNFDFSEEQKLLQNTARDYLAEQSSLAHVREIFEADAGYSEKLWKGVAELGWLGVAIPEEYGGAGYGYLELAMIAGEIGKALAPIPFGSTVYLAAEAISREGNDDQKKQYLTGIASGDLIGAFATFEKAGTLTEKSISATFKNGKLSGTKLPVADGDIADFAVVLADSGNGLSLAVVELSASGVTRSKIECIDPSRSIAKIEFADAPAELLGEGGKGGMLAEALLDRAAILMAFEQIGSACRALEITKQYTLERYAFGRPIGSFQAVKHKCAEMLLNIECASACSHWASWVAQDHQEELAEAAAVALCVSTDSYLHASQENLQIHGGIGFTWEADPQLFFKRAKSNESLLGHPTFHRERLTRELGL